VGGRQGCTVRTDSHGGVYVFYEGAYNHHSEQKLVYSANGGVNFGQPRNVAPVVDVGAPDQVTGDVAFDGVAGARTDSFPSVDIANGAPCDGTSAPNTIVVGWSDARNGLDHEQSLVTFSTDWGATFSPPQPVSPSGSRPDFTAVVISPNGSDLYVTYDNFLTGFQPNTDMPRPFEGVVRHADLNGGALSTPVATVVTGAVQGDARSSSANALNTEFLGDYNYLAATNTGATAVYNDARRGVYCNKIDTYRQALVAGQSPMPPNPDDCQPGFGNSDIYAAAVGSP